MTERLLQYIWQFQYFDNTDMFSRDGIPVTVIFPGTLNTDQGPDFQGARILIGSTIWAGSVELHVKSSGWEKHGHHRDRNYSGVVLHVVWDDDGGTCDPQVLELKGRVPGLLLKRHEQMMLSGQFISCEKLLGDVPELTWLNWKDRLMAERLMRKAARAEQYFKQSDQNWQETFWWLLARSFGLKVNADAFEAIARSIPLNLLVRNKDSLQRLEALLLGQAGLLRDTFFDKYAVMLQKEYKFLQHKYELKPASVPVFFLRMRPGSFPTVRLAQLAQLIFQSTQLFSHIRDTESVKEVKQWLDVTANDYWHYRYRFDVPSPFKKKILGAAMINNIIINTLCPVLFAFGNYHDDDSIRNKALKWLEETRAEQNTITKKFMRLGVENRNAFDSQALVELKTRYCDKKRCLECSVGCSLLKPELPE